MTPDAWGRLFGSNTTSETRTDEPCPCAEILTASAMIAVAALSASMRGDDDRADRLLNEVEELHTILANHTEGLVSSEALLDWKHARAEQAGVAS